MTKKMSKIKTKTNSSDWDKFLKASQSIWSVIREDVAQSKTVMAIFFFKMTFQ